LLLRYARSARPAWPVQQPLWDHYVAAANGLPLPTRRAALRAAGLRRKRPTHRATQRVVPLDEGYRCRPHARDVPGCAPALVRLPGQAWLSMERSAGGGSRVHAAVLTGGWVCAPIWPRRRLVRPGHQPVAHERQRTTSADCGAAQLRHGNGAGWVRSSGPALPAAVRVRSSDVLKGPGRLAVGASQMDPQRWSTRPRRHPFRVAC
jgi:hypothetical protein